jgi:hypothetical protein
MKFSNRFATETNDQSQSQQGTKDLTGVGPPSLNNETVYTSGINQRYQNRHHPDHSSRLHLEHRLHVQNCLCTPKNSTGNRVTSTTVQIPAAKST